MSAWIVSKAHIDALVTAAQDFGVIMLRQGAAMDNPDAIGAMLWRENYKSVNHRYSEKARCPAYKFQRRAVPLTPVEVLKSIACLDYQSCEHRGWRGSDARAFLDRLTDAAINNLEGYDKAPWGIDS